MQKAEIVRFLLPHQANKACWTQKEGISHLPDGLTVCSMRKAETSRLPLLQLVDKTCLMLKVDNARHFLVCWKQKVGTVR